jgi:hypothetical protein
LASIFRVNVPAVLERRHTGMGERALEYGIDQFIR